MRHPRCPLCDASIDGDQGLRAHLASVHDLEDDPGTTSTFESIAMYAANPLPVPEPGDLLTRPALDVPHLNVYDPHSDDDRWRPVVIGVGGLLVLLLAVVALTLSP